MQIKNVVKKFNHEFYEKMGTYNFLRYDDIINIEKEHNRYFEVEFCDVSWMLLKNGVIEKLEYPWFKFDTKVALLTDSYSFCKQLQSLGKDYKIMVDSNTKLGYRETIQYP